MALDIESLRSKVLFLGLNDAQLQSLAAVARREVLQAGETLIEAGRMDDAVTIVDEGSVELVETRDGVERRVVFETGSYVDDQTAGDVLGEFSLLDLAPWRGRVAARERSVLLRFQRDDLYDLFSRDLDLQIGVILNIARALARRLRVHHRELAASRAGVGAECPGEDPPPASEVDGEGDSSSPRPFPAAPEDRLGGRGEPRRGPEA